VSADANNDDHTLLLGQCFSNCSDDHRERDQIRKLHSTFVFACKGKDAANGEDRGGGIRLWVVNTDIFK